MDSLPRMLRRDKFGLSDRIGSWSCKNAAAGALDSLVAALSARAWAAHALMAAISGLMPTMFITRVRL